MNEPQSGFPLHWPTGWPRTKTTQHSRFGERDNGGVLRPIQAYRARAELKTELGRLGAERVVVSSNQPLRRDGEPREDRAPPTDKGVAVYFTMKGQKRVLACDKWDRIPDNLYAIAKTIEATRGIERWGSVTTEQAFAGYAALPEKTQLSCWEVLEVQRDGLQLATESGRKHAEEIIVRAWREKVRLTHPDNGGTPETFAAVNAAKDMALQLIHQ